ncbi:efflux RND transporter periplasmic adaptor subunit [Fretibacter rubidus]|uniref:efflux RND transporter periplasmic adaptor subunit n=1 Tax=Fretibacter rubidus TaxID=570162 RepID=UPI00352ADDFB
MGADPLKTIEPAPKPQAAPATPLQRLVTLEGEALKTTDRLALKHMAVNTTRKLIPAGHIIWLSRAGNAVKIEAISSQADVDNTSPFVQWMRAQMNGRARAGEIDSTTTFEFQSRRTDDNFTYPFPYALSVPLGQNGHLGVLLLTRDTAFTESETALATRLARLYGTQWAALGAKKRARMTPRKKTVFLGIVAALVACGFIPVPMTTLAPAEVTASNPFVITAPMDGVIDQILVPANSAVIKDQPLMRLVDTSYRNEYLLAEGEESVAKAKLRQASLTSFVDEAAKREIAIARAEQELAAARKAYARDRLSRTVLSAPMDGLALFSDPQSLMGKPVATGEAVMQIADPARVLLRIDAPLTAGETLQSGARVRLFLDSDPLSAIEARIDQASYYAAPKPDGTMAYTVYARFEASDNTARIGARGVAKIYGQTAPLGFWLLRRPITIARQFVGF